MRKISLALLALVSLASCIHLAAEIATHRYRRTTQVIPELRTPTVAEQNADWCLHNDCSRAPLKPVNVLIDTHAHLSMGPGLGPVFSGKPWALEHEPLWSDMFSEKMAVERLRSAGFGIIVVSLYANALFVWPKTVPQAIYEEIEQTHELISRYPDLFTLATTSEQARRALTTGKIVLVFHLEGAEWAMRSEADVAALYRAGVRFSNPVHLYDSWIGGSDLQAGGRVLINPPGYGHSHVVNGHRENRMGLTREGKELLRSFLDYGIVADASHMSRQSLRDLDAMPEYRKVPFFNSHMPDLEWTTPSERGVNEETLRILREHDGLLGFVPSASAPRNTERYEGLCPATVETFAAMYADAVKMGGGVPIAFASDFNGGIGHSKPTHGDDGCYPASEAKAEFDTRGLADVGFVPQMLAAFAKQGVSTDPMYASSERFLQIWARVEAGKRK
jgi:microsomal dipeptidase-like Zn-dependent dipeptidase